MELTRRHMLAGAAGIVSAPLLPALSAHATAPMADKQAPSFYRYKVGDIEVNPIFDGSTTFALAESFIPNAKLDDVKAALDKAFLPQDKMTLLFTPLAIKMGGKVIILDTGMGPDGLAASKGTNGQFQTNLIASGIPLEAVDTVVISHFHGDHINGLLNADGKLAFPNAEVLVPAVEWKFFMDDGEMSRAPEGGCRLFSERAARARSGAEKEGDALRVGQGSRAGIARNGNSRSYARTYFVCAVFRCRQGLHPVRRHQSSGAVRRQSGLARSLTRMPQWPKPPAAGSMTCWPPTKCGFRASTTHSPASATSSRKAAVTAWCPPNGAR